MCIILFLCDEDYSDRTALIKYPRSVLWRIMFTSYTFIDDVNMTRLKTDRTFIQYSWIVSNLYYARANTRIH